MNVKVIVEAVTESKTLGVDVADLEIEVQQFSEGMVVALGVTVTNLDIY